MSRSIIGIFWLGILLCPLLVSAQAASAREESRGSLERALQLARMHRYEEAEAAMRGVQPPEDREPRIAFFRLRASIASGLGHATAAAADMEAASKLDPENVDLSLAAGIARLEAQLETDVDPGTTLQALRSIVLGSSQQLALRLHLAELLSRANLYAEAATDLDEASQLAPERADIFFDLALARFRNGAWDAALASAGRARALGDGGSVESLIGDIQEKRGDALAAVHAYQAAVTLEPKLEGHRIALALELLRHQTFDAALVVLEQAAGLFPQSVRIRVLLGLTYFLVDRSPDATQALLEAARLDAEDEIAARYLGEVTLRDTAAPVFAAITEICKFADQHPSSKSASAYCGGVLLRAAQDSGDRSRKQEILHRLQEAARIAPDEPIARCQLGKALEWAERWEEARGQTEKCVLLDPDSPEGHYRLARIYRHLGLTTEANEQSAIQRQAAQRQSEESMRRTNTVTRFLVLLDR